MEIRSSNVYLLDATPERVWDAFLDVGNYRDWWPWLREFEATALEDGERWHCSVRPPLPYELRFVIEHTEVCPPTSVKSVISGDISGEAELTLRDSANRTELTLRSSLTPRRRLLRSVFRYSPWLARYGHDQVIKSGFDQFERVALTPAPGEDPSVG